MVLPSGFALPPAPYLAALVVGALAVSALLVVLEPPIDQRAVAGLAPWMAVGGALHALGRPPIEAFGPALGPFFGAPAVYVTTYVALGAVWAALAWLDARRGADGAVSRTLGLVGVVVLAALLVQAALTALRSGRLALVWPTVAVVGSVVLAALVLLAVARWRAPMLDRTRYAAPVVVFAHAFDGVSTAIGTDVIGVGERSPVPRAIMEFAGTLPTAPLIGKGWLFALVKLLVAVAVVALTHRYIEEEPVEGSLLLAFVAAVGLGPATNNVVLFLFTPV